MKKEDVDARDRRGHDVAGWRALYCVMAGRKARSAVLVPEVPAIHVFLFFVIAGLVPAIHVLSNMKKEDVDARDRRGHDVAG
jgi:hypothetical protein